MKYLFLFIYFVLWFFNVVFLIHSLFLLAKFDFDHFWIFEFTTSLVIFFITMLFCKICKKIYLDR